MLTEFPNLRQEGDIFRRLYSDAEILLYLWYRDLKQLYGIQIIILEEAERLIDLPTGAQVESEQATFLQLDGTWTESNRAFSWTLDRGPSYARVESGGAFSPTPYLVEIAPFGVHRLLAAVLERLPRGFEAQAQQLLLRLSKEF